MAEQENPVSGIINGHGHINPRQLKAKCGGPGMCQDCAIERCRACNYIGALHCPKCLRCPGTHHESSCVNEGLTIEGLDSEPGQECICRGLPDPEFDIDCPIHGEHGVNAAREREEIEYDDLPPDLREIVYQAVGAASMCWSNINGAGVFNSTQASKVARQLVLDIQEITLPRPSAILLITPQPPSEPDHEEDVNQSGICYFCGGTEGDIWPFHDFQEEQEIQAHTPCARNNPDRVRLNGE